MFAKEYIHNRYWDTTRHWHASSEPFASGEQLQSMLREGWEMDKVVFRTEHHLKNSNRIIIFYVIALFRADEKMNMPVLANPYIDSLVACRDVQVVYVERRQPEKITEATTVTTAVVVNDDAIAATG